MAGDGRLDKPGWLVAATPALLLLTPFVIFTRHHAISPAPPAPPPESDDVDIFSTLFAIRSPTIPRAWTCGSPRFLVY